LFAFAPPDDSENDREALQERVAIIMEANGWTEAQALQEACWQEHRERCWRTFLRNARRIEAASAAERELLLRRYQTEAERRYGAQTAALMTATMRNWLLARPVQ
jgi:hypothetical protein